MYNTSNDYPDHGQCRFDLPCHGDRLQYLVQHAKVRLEPSWTVTVLVHVRAGPCRDAVLLASSRPHFCPSSRTSTDRASRSLAHPQAITVADTDAFRSRSLQSCDRLHSSRGTQIRSTPTCRSWPYSVAAHTGRESPVEGKNIRSAQGGQNHRDITPLLSQPATDIPIFSATTIT